MANRQEFMQQLVDLLQSTPALPDYLAAEPTDVQAFDPYQMVSEWIALRQEMKQQGKLLQSTQEQWQRELERLRLDNDALQQQLTECQQQVSTRSATELAAQAQQFESEQEKGLRSLLKTLDAIDQACAYWDEQVAAQPAPVGAASLNVRTQIAHWLLRSEPSKPRSTPSDLSEILKSGRQGVLLIRQNLLDLLKQQQVLPLQALRQPFNPQSMYAIGREANEAPANTVIQEVTRGYLWRDRVLREAQVIVSAGPNH